jgi:thiosulfate/3-mercaptopyruvate sulfurtransferase
MRHVLWRIALLLLVVVALLLLTGCKLIQAPSELANTHSADVLRGPYEWQDDLAAAPVSDELALTADVLRSPYEWQETVVAAPVSDELYGWEKVAAEEYAAKLAGSALVQDELAVAPTESLVAVSAELAGYPNPQALATTEWLATHLGDSTIRVIDVRRPTGAANFAAAHIPGAQHVDLMVDLMDRDPNRVALDLIGPERFADLMGRLGIANDSTVVVYDAEGGTAAATMWWAMRYYGHDDVRMLNGGLVKWLLEGRETLRTVTHFAPTDYVVNVQSHLLATAQDIDLAMSDRSIFVVDARDPEFFTGERCHSAAPRAGHIPGAQMMPARWQVTPDLKMLLPAERLAMSLELMGISPTQRGITYCGNGHLAAFDAFLLYVMGFENVAVYDSSWLEWGVLPEMPVETGCPECEPL